MSKAKALESFDVKETCVPEKNVKVRKRRCYAILVIAVLSFLVFLN
ncbi:MULTISPECIES: hypothetical protein [unclassified Roseovarius]|nr:hypothetical protein [Roseovarius sp. MMSF_3350]